MTITTEQVVNLPYRYIQGLNLSNASDKTLNLSSGQVRDSTNQFDLYIPNAITLNGEVQGVNGVSPGLTLAGNLFYSIFVIGSSRGSKSPAAIISTFGQTPIFPEGYDIFSFVGVWNTDGAINFTKMYQSGSNSKRTYFYDTSSAVLSGGSALTFTAVDLFPGVPSIPGINVALKIDYTPGLADHFLKLRPTGSSNINHFVFINALVDGVQQDSIANMPALISGTNASVDYMVNATGDSVNLYVYGFSYGE